MATASTLLSPDLAAPAVALRFAPDSQDATRAPATVGCRIGAAAEQARSAHPSREWSSARVIQHIRDVHHRRLRDSLARLAELLQKPATRGAAHGPNWEAFGQRFAKLQNELLTGVACEESVVFPQLMHWDAAGGQRPPPAELCAAVESVERSHARCLHLVWRLLRLVRDEASIVGSAGSYCELLEVLSALCDDYEQQLLEEECLLLPRLKSRPASEAESLKESG